LQIVGKGYYPQTGQDTSTPDYWAENTIKTHNFEDVWDLKDANIAFGLKLYKNQTVKQNEQIFICYGERSNSFLLVEYGFAIPMNNYDFYRVNNVTIADFCDTEIPTYRGNLETINLKYTLRADLKIMGLHRDVLKMIRANQPQSEDNL